MAEPKIPTRPAPAPPKINGHASSNSKRILHPSNLIPTHFKLSRSQSSGKLGENKKPPPRPPPPVKSTASLKSANNSFRSYSQLLSGLSLGKSSKNSTVSGGLARSQTTVGLREPNKGGLLIDLSSPPSSPTLTVRSSSDGFSLNSFNSDGPFTGLNSVGSSQVESGFEDDFDLLMMSPTSAGGADPWSVSRTTAGALPFELSNEDPRSRYKAVSTMSVGTMAATRPTIIRAKSSRPPRPPPPRLRPASTPPSLVSFTADLPDDWSPPMPSIPPPPPPPEVLTGPRLPPRPSTSVVQESTRKKPYCIALYDYNSGHPDDLCFKTNDVIYLRERVSEEWLRGQLHGREGMFPVNYINIVVPLDENSDEDTDIEKGKCVIALYTFRPETWDDLPFQEGDTIKVIRRINKDWLYGENGGKQGQFPESYVTTVPLFSEYS